MLTDFWLVCRLIWCWNFRDDFKQVFSHLEGEHHWAGRICKLPTVTWSLSRVTEPGSESRRGELCWNIASLFWVFPLLNYCNSWRKDAWICFLSKKKNLEAICLKAGIGISVYTCCVTFLFFNPVLHFQVILSKQFLMSLVLVSFHRWRIFVIKYFPKRG